MLCVETVCCQHNRKTTHAITNHNLHDDFEVVGFQNNVNVANLLEQMSTRSDIKHKRFRTTFPGKTRYKKQSECGPLGHLGLIPELCVRTASSVPTRRMLLHLHAVHAYGHHFRKHTHTCRESLMKHTKLDAASGEIQSPESTATSVTTHRYEPLTSLLSLLCVARCPSQGKNEYKTSKPRGSKGLV
jgi:hypothetical protein